MAESSHKRDTNARRLPRPSVLAGSIAALATLSVVSVGVLSSSPAASVLMADDPADTGSGQVATVPEVELAADRGLAPLSRSAVRGTTLEEVPTALERITAPKAVARAVAAADDRRWSTDDLNLWSGPSDAAANVGLIETAEKVLATGRTFMGRDEIVVGGESRWVTAGYLDDEKPEPEPEPAPETAPEAEEATTTSGRTVDAGGGCTNGTSVPSGVSPNIVSVHAAVCAAWPEISTYGTFRSDGEHAQGIAVDIMTSGQTGYDIADYLRANAGSLGINYIIYSQQIWSVDRAGEGWRGMEDRGSTTANHYDHVHVTTY
ncbi:hypothetical protein ENKNEFLB_02020 [Nocardioides aquaticus]|uniref:ARB-07466-like C-terminal domain-containing protein n=1 Tax=Nocardioides aquaticus TaxID=160826 RepID=A0ABX8EKK9_9ACTN|nr:mucin-2 protein [Nocardioides aquaticus]QVT79637.1 hypothetical protein ENKNEFLB_02020 [Nocardioides aquaticus]